MRKYLSLLLLTAVVALPIASSQTPTPSASPKHQPAKKTENASASPASAVSPSASPTTGASPGGSPKKTHAKNSPSPAASPVTVATPSPVPSPTAKSPLRIISGNKAS